MPFRAPTERSPRLLVVSTVLPEHGWGGSENFWFDALRAGVADGWHVAAVVSRSTAAQKRADDLNRINVEVVWNTSRSASGVTRGLAAGQRRLGRFFHRVIPDLETKWWQRLFARFKPDLVWFNLSTIESLPTTTAGLAKRTGAPFWIVVQHVSEDWFPWNDHEADTVREALLAARRVIFIAKNNRRTVERSIATTLPNAYMSANTVSDAFLERAESVSSHRRPRQTGQATLLNVARFEPSFKGQHLLLEVLSQPPWMERAWRLVLVGGGFLANTVERLVAYYGLDAQRVEIRGFTTDLPELLASADLALMPSLSEGTPYAAIEAMAAGRPVVATPVGGFPELVRDGETGWLAEAADAQHFALALERAWSSRPTWPEIGQAAAAHVQRNYRSETAWAGVRTWLNRDGPQR